MSRGVVISGIGTRGRLEGCIIVGNKFDDVAIEDGAKPWPAKIET